MILYLIARLLGADAPPPASSGTNPLLIPLIGVAAAFAGGIGVWLAAKVQARTTKDNTSGKISTSEAASLWEQTQAMLADRQGEVQALRDRLDKVETAAAEQREKLSQMAADSHTTLLQLQAANEKLAEYEEKITELRAEVRRLRKRTQTVSSDLGSIRREMSVAATSPRRKRTTDV